MGDVVREVVSDGWGSREKCAWGWWMHNVEGGLGVVDVCGGVGVGVGEDLRGGCRACG